MIKLSGSLELIIPLTLSDSQELQFEEELKSLFDFFTQLPSSIPMSKRYVAAFKLLFTSKSKAYKVSLTEPVSKRPIKLRKEVILQLGHKLNKEDFYLFDFVGTKHVFLRNRSEIVGILGIAKGDDEQRLLLISLRKLSDNLFRVLKELSL